VTPPALADLVARATAAGVLPASASPPDPDEGDEGDEGRPWPVVLLTALGAWLAAVPLLVFVSMLLGPLFELGAGPYLAGALGIGLAWWLWRRAGHSPFVEQLAVPLLLAGLGSLGAGVFRDLPLRWGAAVLAAVVLLLAVALQRNWLRLLLGAAAAVLAALALGTGGGFGGGAAASRMSAVEPWLAWLLTLAIGVGAIAWGDRAAPARLRPALLEPVACGWLLAAIAGHAWLAGMTFLVAGSLGGPGGAHAAAAAETHGLASLVMRSTSALLAVAAALWLARSWPVLRTAPYAVVALTIAALAAFMTTLGAVCLALAACLVSHRWRRAAAAALAAAWIVGAFYYALSWPLATKAAVLAAAGLVLAGVAWALARSGAGQAPGTAPPARARGAHTWLLPIALLGVLATSGLAIWQKERLIAEGRPAFVELAPVDPRSLMQGDFMRLAYAMPAPVQAALERTETTARPRVAAQRDARDVLRVTRLLAPGEAPGAGEEAIELSPKDGRWVIVTDAWFFREGEAARWEQARYGEFRLLPDGRALLVGLRGAGLQPL